MQMGLAGWWAVERLGKAARELIILDLGPGLSWGTEMTGVCG